MEFIDVFHSLQHVLCLVCFPKVVQKRTMAEVKTKNYLIASCVGNISAKYFKNLLIFV